MKKGKSDPSDRESSDEMSEGASEKMTEQKRSVVIMNRENTGVQWPMK